MSNIILTDFQEAFNIQRSGGPCGVSQSTEEAGKGVKEQVSRGPGSWWLVGGRTRASGGTACLWAGPARGCKLTTAFQRLKMGSQGPVRGLWAGRTQAHCEADVAAGLPPAEKHPQLPPPQGLLCLCPLCLGSPLPCLQLQAPSTAFSTAVLYHLHHLFLVRP